MGGVGHADALQIVVFGGSIGLRCTDGGGEHLHAAHKLRSGRDLLRGIVRDDNLIVGGRGGENADNSRCEHCVEFFYKVIMDIN